jgi:hypothetical protein
MRHSTLKPRGRVGGRGKQARANELIAKGDGYTFHQEKVLHVDMRFFLNMHVEKKSHVDMEKSHVNMRFFPNMST